MKRSNSVSNFVAQRFSNASARLQTGFKGDKATERLYKDAADRMERKALSRTSENFEVNQGKSRMRGESVISDGEKTLMTNAQI